MKRKGAICSICEGHGKGLVFHWDTETETWICKRCFELANLAKET